MKTRGHHPLIKCLQYKEKEYAIGKILLIVRIRDGSKFQINKLKAVSYSCFLLSVFLMNNQETPGLYLLNVGFMDLIAGIPLAFGSISL